MSNQYDKFLEDSLEDSFSETEESPHKEFWVVLFRGKRVHMKNGKGIWKQKNHAACAVRNHISDVIRWPYYNADYTRNETYSDCAEQKRAVDDWIKDSIEVITYTEWMSRK
jgi:hypothetical protein